jgi:hypothetical protein
VEEGDDGEIREDKFLNERWQCKKLNLVLPKELMPMDIGTQLAWPQSHFNANKSNQIKMLTLSPQPGQTTINKIYIRGEDRKQERKRGNTRGRGG